MTLDIYVHKLNLIETMLFCEHCTKYWNFTQSPGVEILHKQTVSVDPWTIHPKTCGNCLPTENLHTKKSEEIPALYVVEATFAIIYLCLLFNAGLNFSIKCVSYYTLLRFCCLPELSKLQIYQ